MKPLRKFLDDASIHREAIKRIVPELKTNLEKCLIYLDFTKWTIVEDGGVNCFVVTIVSGPGSTSKKGCLFDLIFV